MSEDPLKISGRLCIYQFLIVKDFFKPPLSCSLLHLHFLTIRKKHFQGRITGQSVKVTSIQLPSRIRFAVLERLLEVALPSLSSQFIWDIFVAISAAPFHPLLFGTDPPLENQYCRELSCIFLLQWGNSKT